MDWKQSWNASNDLTEKTYSRFKAVVSVFVHYLDKELDKQFSESFLQDVIAECSSTLLMNKKFMSKVKTKPLYESLQAFTLVIKNKILVANLKNEQDSIILNPEWEYKYKTVSFISNESISIQLKKGLWKKNYEYACQTGNKELIYLMDVSLNRFRKTASPLDLCNLYLYISEEYFELYTRIEVSLAKTVKYLQPVWATEDVIAKDIINKKPIQLVDPALYSKPSQPQKLSRYFKRS